ncbi:MAG: hypothetical protein LBV40_06780 [Methanomicrobiales archaeon]|jgi:hypothetical protein|nr:hypothetical protein [Methanomicrobiales archaeon]
MTEERKGEYINQPFILEGEDAIAFDEYLKNPTITEEGIIMVKESIRIGKRLLCQQE